MYNMNMVVTYTITKIQLLTRKCRESNLNMCFKKQEKKKKNEVHRKKQIIKLANTKSFCPHKHTFLKTSAGKMLVSPSVYQTLSLHLC